MLTATAGEFVLRHFWASHSQQPTSRRLAAERLKQGPVDVIFVGSSHIRNGVNPAYFPYSVVNISESAMNYQMAEILCHKYWDRVTHAKLVVLELDAVLVHGNPLRIGTGDFRRFLDWGVSATELPLPPWDKFKASFLEKFTSTRVKSMWPYIVSPPAKPQNNIGPGFHPRTDPLILKEHESQLLALGSEWIPEPSVGKNLQCLKQLLIDLHRAGVKVKMLRPPFHIAHWQHVKGPGRNSESEQALDIFLEIPGNSESDVIDLRYLLQSEDECFADLVHLTALGAKRHSEHLAWIIDLKEL